MDPNFCGQYLIFHGDPLHLTAVAAQTLVHPAQTLIPLVQLLTEPVGRRHVAGGQLPDLGVVHGQLPATDIPDAPVPGLKEHRLPGAQEPGVPLAVLQPLPENLRVQQLRVKQLTADTVHPGVDQQGQAVGGKEADAVRQGVQALLRRHGREHCLPSALQPHEKYRFGTGQQ